MKKRILVSACLLGFECNYKGACAKEYSENPSFWNKVFDFYEVIPVCPEQLGGLSTPRNPSELTGLADNVYRFSAKIISNKGIDVTHNFVKGAEEVLRLAKLLHVEFAVLKSRSPSCGKDSVYDGTFSGRLIPGAGLTCFLLMKNGYKVLTELDFINSTNSSEE